MTLGLDILLADDWDLDLSNGDLTMSVNIAQNIKLRLQYIAREWFLDITKGQPYFELVFVKQPNLTHVGSMFRTCIRETPGVTSLDTFSMDYDNATRTLTVTFTATTSQGEVSEDLTLTLGI